MVFKCHRIVVSWIWFTTVSRQTDHTYHNTCTEVGCICFKYYSWYM